MSNETARWALYKQYEEVNQNFRTVWQLYLALYTAVVTVNVAAVAFVRSSTLQRPMGWVAFAFVSIDLLVAASSLFVLDYTRGAVQHAVEIAKDIADFALATGESLDASKCFRPTLPRRLCEWASWANVAGMLLVSAAWIAVYVDR